DPGREPRDPGGCRRARRGVRDGQGRARRARIRATGAPRRRGTSAAGRAGRGRRDAVGRGGRGDRRDHRVRARRPGGRDRGRGRGGRAAGSGLGRPGRAHRGGVVMAEITAAMVKALRDATGAGMMDCKRALIEADGDADRATELLRERGLASQAKRAGRTANQGLVEAYIHFNNTVGVLIEVNCETDFVANTDEFRALVKDLALHIASPSAPRWLSRDDIPTDTLDHERRIFEAQARESGKPDNVIPRIVEGKLEAFFKDTVLLDQDFVKDDSTTIQGLLDEVGAKTGEKAAVRRFTRYRLGEDPE